MMKVNRPLVTGAAPWSMSIIERLWPIIDNIGKKDLGLDYNPPQFEIVSAEQMLDVYTSNGMPTFYNHWTFGREFQKMKHEYRTGKMNLAYELVINSNPAIAYLMDTNSAAMQALVMAHASVGHASFFKMNYMYKQHANPDNILNLLTNIKETVDALETTYGLDHVETLLDDLHAISKFGVDKYTYKEKDEIRESNKKQARILNELALQNPDFYNLPYNRRHKLINKWALLFKKAATNNRYCVKNKEMLELDNFYRFIELYSLALAPDELKLVKYLRILNQYFYPQYHDKIINEGWATFCHYYIIKELYNKKYLDEGAYIEILSSHTSVCNQRQFSLSNPYAIGFAIFMDIKRACENPDAEDRIYLSDVVGKEWREVMRNIIKYYKDDSFILQYLSPKVIRKFGLFSINKEDDNDYLTVTGIQNEADVQQIRNILSQSRESDNFTPNLKISCLDKIENLVYITYKPYKDREVEDSLENLNDIMYRLTGYSLKIEPEGEE